MHCPPHQFQCGSQECLDRALVCNGYINCADGSDEGGSCQMTCTEEEMNHCSQSCYSTPQGTVRTANRENGSSSKLYKCILMVIGLVYSDSC